MYKIPLVILLLLSAGCASQGTINILQVKVQALDERMVTVENSISTLNSDVKKLETDMDNRMTAVENDILAVRTEAQNNFKEINSVLVSVDRKTDAIKKKLYPHSHRKVKKHVAVKTKHVTH
jgi:predicted  nucleic acid-binding Zn-ribbon protein